MCETSEPTKPLADARSCLAVVLAAGEGTRMNSSLPKVLHRIAGRSMLGHVLTAVGAAGASGIAVVVGPGRDDAAAEARRHAGDAVVAVQHERLGTAHAVLTARHAIAACVARNRDCDILVAFADTPLVRPQTLARLRAALAEGAAVAVLGFQAADPRGYGRLIRDGDGLIAIREENDASAAEAALTLCNGGLMGLAGRHALAILDAIGNANAKGEYYLTDAVAVARASGLGAVAVLADEDEVMGVNDRVQLARAEASMQDRLRRAIMADGVTLVAPETVFLSADTVIGRDAVIEPHVYFGPGVRIEEGAIIHAFSHFERAHIGRGAEVGPFARLRPGADLGANCRIGNFVEVKNATFGEGAKANHLTYVGDASIGARANIGAGTITSNYDGFGKYRTLVGEGVFIGSNSALVAPVSIGAGAYVGSGSVITADVPADALALGRGRQVVKPGWAKAFRQAAADKRKAKAESKGGA